MGGEQELGGWRGQAARLVEAIWFQRFITVVIVVNAIGLGLETSSDVMARAGATILFVDRLALWIFVVEILLKLFAYRFRFFTNGWNIFDFVVVGIALIPFSGPFAVLRALRVLRVLRLFSMVPRLRSVVDALLTALPGMGSILIIMGIVFYAASVVATKLFGEGFPQWFGDLGSSMYSLFQIMTLESWSMGIVRPLMERYPYAWMFFVPFVIITSFTVLNLFIALLVNTIQEQHQQEHDAEMSELKEAAHLDAAALGKELEALRQEMAELRNAIVEHRTPPPAAD